MGNGIITDLGRYAWRGTFESIPNPIEDMQNGNYSGALRDAPVISLGTGLIMGRGKGSGDEGLIPGIFHDLIYDGNGGGALTHALGYAWNSTIGSVLNPIGDICRGDWGGFFRDLPVISLVTGLFMGRGNSPGDQGLILGLWHDFVEKPDYNNKCNEDYNNFGDGGDDADLYGCNNLDYSS